MKTRKLLSLALALVMVLALVPTATAVDTTYKTWSQYDSRWGSMSISSTGNGNWTMGRHGCYITAVAKILVHAGQQNQSSFTPKECLQGMLNHGMLNADGDIMYGNFNNSFLPTYGPELYKETSPSHGEWDKSTAVSTIGGKIRDGYYVIVCVINGSTGNTHYMAVDNVSDDIYVMDNEGIYGVYGSGRYSGVRDQVYFKYNGSKSYPAIDGGSTGNKTETGSSTSGTKTQYRYHRYENADGSDYFVCAYLGLSYYPSMKLVYSDWVDTPYPEVKKGYVNYLEHPRQSGCERAGCLSTDPFEVHRHVATDGKVWYYEETRTVATEEPAKPSTSPEPTPNCANGHTFGEWETVKAASCGVEGQRERVCSVCGEKETETIAALEHDYRVDGETDEAVYYVCANCGDNYTEEKKPSETGKGDFQNFTTQNRYTSGSFGDVKSGDWFYENVKATYELGLMKGTGSGTFSPGNNVTLAEAITLAARIHSIYYTGSDSFASYDGGNWYDSYVDYAREKGIVNTYYNYSRPATREEFVRILAKALPEEALENIAGQVSFADSRDITYMAEVRLLSGAGVINGIQESGKTYFKPLNTITRAEVAAVVARMAKPSQRVGG